MTPDQEPTPMALDKTIEAYQNYFYEAGFDEFAIDLTYVPEEVVVLLGETLKQRSLVRKVKQKLAAMNEQGEPQHMEFLLTPERTLDKLSESEHTILQPFRMLSIDE